MNRDELIKGLPGEALLREGLGDFEAGRETVASCLVRIATARFRRAGLIAFSPSNPCPEPELQLYGLLRRQGGDAYSQYNALLRELVSFEQALDRRLARSGK